MEYHHCLNQLTSSDGCLIEYTQNLRISIGFTHRITLSGRGFTSFTCPFHLVAVTLLLVHRISPCMNRLTGSIIFILTSKEPILEVSLQYILPVISRKRLPSRYTNLDQGFKYGRSELY